MLRQLLVLKERRFVSLAFLGAAIDTMEADRGKSFQTYEASITAAFNAYVLDVENGLG